MNVCERRAQITHGLVKFQLKYMYLVHFSSFIQLSFSSSLILIIQVFYRNKTNIMINQSLHSKVVEPILSFSPSLVGKI